MNNHLPQVSRNPIYLQVRKILLDKIQEGIWTSGEQLPTEPVLSKQLGVSIGTLRRAVEMLVNEGLLLRREGVGTFVRTYKNSGYWNSFQIYTDKEGKRRGRRWSIVSFDECEIPPPDIATALQIQTSPVIHFVRHWYHIYGDEEKLVSIDESYLIAERFKGLTLDFFLDKFKSGNSLYQFFDREFGVVIVSQKCSAQYEKLTESDARKFKVPCNYESIRTDRISYTFGHKPVEYRINRGQIDVTKISFDLQ